MPPAVIAGVGAAASIGGALLSSSAQKKAANKASQTAADNTAANNALSREMYANNASRLDPFASNGLRASNALSDMLLGPSPTPTAAPTSTSGGVQHALSDVRPAAMSRFGMTDGALGGPQTLPGSAQPGTVISSVPAQNPWDQFRKSTNYRFRLNQGMEGINQDYAAHGTLQSGAAQKALLQYGQNFASNELGHYQDLLAQQQGMGMSAASALAGVGQNMVGQVTANNNSAANVAANAALANGQANANMYTGIAGGIGQIAGALGSSYRAPTAATIPGFSTGYTGLDGFRFA